jgi:acyl-CoA-binding protein
MIQKDLNTRFQEAFENASNMTQALPQDVMLRLYAYYKQATSGTAKYYNQSENFGLIDAFKTNAWIQISHLSPDEAKEEYIKTINSLLDK